MFCLIFGLPVRGSRCQDGATAAQIGKWIEQLSDEQFLVRDQARSNLREAGATAYDQLYQARETKDLEARLTIRELLSVIQVHWIRESDTPAVVNMMLGFQQRKPEERLAIIDRLSWFPSGESWPALYRIVVYDSSSLVRDHAAARFLEMLFEKDAGPDAKLKMEIEKRLFLKFASLELLMDSNAGWAEKVIGLAVSLSGGSGSILRFDKYGLAIKLQQQELQTLVAGKNATGKIDPRLIFARLTANRTLYRQLPEARKELCRELDQIGIRLATLAAEESCWRLLLETLCNNRRKEAVEGAEENWEKLVAKDPVIGFLLADFFWREGRLAESRESIARAEESVRKNGLDEELFAEELLERKLIQAATLYLQTLRKRMPLSVSLELLLAELEWRQGNLKKVVALASEVMKQTGSAGDFARCAGLLAAVAREEGRPQDAYRWLSEGLKKEPLSTGLLIQIHTLADSLPDFDRQAFERKVAIARGAYLDRFQEGSRLIQSEIPAEENLGRVRMARAACSTARLLSRLDLDQQKALSMARIAVKLEPRNPDYLAALAYCEFRQGQPKRAVRLQRRAIFVSPGNPELESDLQRYQAE
ncbi:MAG: hypothetical protein VX768_00865 [Planctomycetota bacterium]|nr:hypothetical protein [Planctomycetota bacterium]